MRHDGTKRVLWRGLAVTGALVVVTGCLPLWSGDPGDEQQRAGQDAGEGPGEEADATAAGTPQADAAPVEEDDGNEAEDDGADAQEGSPAGEDHLVAEVGDPVEVEGCEPGPGRTVTMLEDVVLEEVFHDGVDTQVIEADGREIELPGAPGILVPERSAQAGCLVEYEAPGGCLPRVEVSDAYIPEVVLPERALPEVELPDGTVLEELVQPEIVVDAVEIDGVVAEEVCQTDEDELEPGDIVWSAVRWSETRWSETQWSETQWSQTRWSTSGQGWRAPTMTLPTAAAPTMTVPTITVPTEVLETYRLDDAEHTERTEGEEQVSYITEGDVLFDPDEHEIRSDAEADLEAIAAEIAQRDDDYVIRVEGHTDDVPTVEYEDNQELSERRAEAVVDRLVEEGGLDADLMSSEGLGEDVPRADNDTAEGRAENRRVVITVESAGREDREVDYELEEGDEEEGDEEDAG